MLVYSQSHHEKVEGPKRQTCANEGQGVMHIVSQVARSTNLPHGDVLRLTVSFELDREVRAGDPIAGEGTVLDLEAVSWVESLEGPPISAVRLDIPRPFHPTSHGFRRAEEGPLSFRGHTSCTMRSARHCWSSDTIRHIGSPGRTCPWRRLRIPLHAG
jgi:hypothetical protein